MTSINRFVAALVLLIAGCGGAQAHTFEMHNVLNVSSKLRAIEDMQREKAEYDRLKAEQANWP